MTLRRAGKNFHHNQCALIAMLYSKMYFDSFRNGRKYGGKGPLGSRIMADIAKVIISHRKKEEHHGGHHHKS